MSRRKYARDLSWLDQIPQRPQGPWRRKEWHEEEQFPGTAYEGWNYAPSARDLRSAVLDSSKRVGPWQVFLEAFRQAAMAGHKGLGPILRDAQAGDLSSYRVLADKLADLGYLDDQQHAAFAEAFSGAEHQAQRKGMNKNLLSGHDWGREQDIDRLGWLRDPATWSDASRTAINAPADMQFPDLPEDELPSWPRPLPDYATRNLHDTNYGIDLPGYAESWRNRRRKVADREAMGAFVAKVAGRQSGQGTHAHQDDLARTGARYSPAEAPPVREGLRGGNAWEEHNEPSSALIPPPHDESYANQAFGHSAQQASDRLQGMARQRKAAMSRRGKRRKMSENRRAPSWGAPIQPNSFAQEVMLGTNGSASAYEHQEKGLVHMQDPVVRELIKAYLNGHADAIFPLADRLEELGLYHVSARLKEEAGIAASSSSYDSETDPLRRQFGLPTAHDRLFGPGNPHYAQDRPPGQFPNAYQQVGLDYMAARPNHLSGGPHQYVGEPTEEEQANQADKGIPPPRKGRDWGPHPIARLRDDHHEQALKMAREDGWDGLDTDDPQRQTDLLKQHGYLPQDGPQKYSGVHSPAGGVVVRGVYYQGGKFIPDAEIEKAAHPQWEAAQKAKAARKYSRDDGSTDTDALMQEYSKGKRP
jgi:hypothetical protein